MQTWQDRETRNPVMVRALREDELEKHGAKPGDHFVMTGPGDVQIVSETELKKKYERPKSRFIRNDLALRRKEDTVLNANSRGLWWKLYDLYHWPYTPAILFVLIWFLVILLFL
jgi:hypothetical protein